MPERDCELCGNERFVPSGLATRLLAAAGAILVSDRPIPVQMSCPKCSAPPHQKSEDKR